AALEQVGRGGLDPDRRVGTLPLADRQLVEIARALAQDARLVILDEPTSSLGRGDVEHLFARIRALAARGVSVLYVSHVLEALSGLGGRSGVLREGAGVPTGERGGEPQPSLVRRRAGRELGELYPRSPSTPGEVVLRVDALAGERLPRAASLEVRRGEVLG